MKHLACILLLLSANVWADSLLGEDSDLYAPVRLVEGDLVTIFISDRVRTRQAVQVENSSNAGIGGPLISLLSTVIGFSPSHDDNDGRDEIANSDTQFEETVTARVASVQGRNLVLEAHRKVVLDGKRRTLVFSGVVRRRDVGSNNRIPSSLVADAVLKVDGLHRSPVAPGIITRALRLFF